MAESLTNFVDWNRALQNVPEEWRTSEGRGIKIGILDSGIYFDHPDLQGAFTQATVIDRSNSPNGFSDTRGHGTHCAGIISARSKGPVGIRGIAPASELYVAKVNHEDFGPTERRVASGIEWAMSQNVDIVNMSLQVDNPDEPRLKAAIKEASAQGIVLIGSAGENGKLCETLFLFPAMEPECISVGCISREYYDSGSMSFNLQLNILLPLVSVWSCDIQENGNYMQRDGSSMAAAIVSGTVALLLSSKSIPKNGPRKDSVLAELASHLKPLKDLAFTNPTTPISPR